MKTLPKILAMLCFALAAFLSAGCPTHNSPSTPLGPLPTPTFAQLQIPSQANGWVSYSPTSPSADVLPVKGRGVRVLFYSAVGGTFGVSLRALDGTSIPLTENHQGSSPPTEAGYFQIIDVNTALNPPLYMMYVRAPLTLADPANYDILVVNRSLRTDATDSAPMVVKLRQRKVFTVTVVVQGDGHVTSNPPGIQCGTTSNGRTLSDCSYDFGPGNVSLAPGSNNPNTRFKGWSGNCAPSVQVCNLTLTGAGAMSAIAMFGPSNLPAPTSNCPTAPLLPGLKWIDLPACATGNIASHPGISNPALCDAQGYFCCEPGPTGSNAPRCGGQGKIESTPDCRHHAPTGMLRQPGGCYELDSGP